MRGQWTEWEEAERHRREEWQRERGTAPPPVRVAARARARVLLTRVLVPDGQKKLADSTAILSAKWLATYRKKVLQPQLKKLKALQAKLERDVAKITKDSNNMILI